jgi:hypothetical protein
MVKLLQFFFGRLAGTQAQTNSHCTGSAPVSSVTVTATLSSPFHGPAGHLFGLSVATALRPPLARCTKRMPIDLARAAVVAHVHADHHAGGGFGQQVHGRGMHAPDGLRTRASLARRTSTLRAQRDEAQARRAREGHRAAQDDVLHPAAHEGGRFIQPHQRAPQLVGGLAVDHGGRGGGAGHHQLRTGLPVAACP